MLPIRDCVTVVGSGMLVPRPDGGWETSMRGVAADGAVERAAACPGGAVRRVLGRFLRQGLDAVPRRRPPGRAVEVTGDWLAELERIIDLNPRAVSVPSAVWTTRLLSGYLERVTGHHAAIETVRVYLHRLGYVCKRPTWSLKRKASQQAG